MRKTPLNKVGVIGKANKEARRRIAEIAEAYELNYCEAKLEGCLIWWALAPAHRHPRSWYKGSVKKLSDHNQWISCCVRCHTLIDAKSKLLEQVFSRLRGKED